MSTLYYKYHTGILIHVDNIAKTILNFRHTLSYFIDIHGYV